MSKRQKYFLKQKLYGVLLILIGIVIALMLGGDGTALIFLVPIGVELIFSRKMWLVDSFYENLKTKESQ